jgi:hypothetical protein
MRKNSVAEPVLATAAFAGDLLLIRGARHLYGIRESPSR